MHIALNRGKKRALPTATPLFSFCPGWNKRRLAFQVRSVRIEEWNVVGIPLSVWCLHFFSKVSSERDLAGMCGLPAKRAKPEPAASLPHNELTCNWMTIVCLYCPGGANRVVMASHLLQKRGGGNSKNNSPKKKSLPNKISQRPTAVYGRNTAWQMKCLAMTYLFRATMKWLEF